MKNRKGLNQRAKTVELKEGPEGKRGTLSTVGNTQRLYYYVITVNLNSTEDCIPIEQKLQYYPEFIQRNR